MDKSGFQKIREFTILVFHYLWTHRSYMYIWDGNFLFLNIFVAYTICMYTSTDNLMCKHMSIPMVRVTFSFRIYEISLLRCKAAAPSWNTIHLHVAVFCGFSGRSEDTARIIFCSSVQLYILHSRIPSRLLFMEWTFYNHQYFMPTGMQNLKLRIS